MPGQNWKESSPEPGLLNVVHRRDGFLGIIFIDVTHKTEPSAATSVAVFDDYLARCWKVRRLAEGLVTPGDFELKYQFNWKRASNDVLLPQPHQTPQISASRLLLPCAMRGHYT